MKDGWKLHKLEVLRLIKKTKLNTRFGIKTKENSIQAGRGSLHSILAKRSRSHRGRQFLPAG